MNKIDEVKLLIGRLKQLEATRQKTREAEGELALSIMGDEIKQKLDDLTDEFTDTYKAISNRKAETEAKIRKLVLELQATQQIDGIKAVYTPASHSWIKAELDGYAEAHPEIKKFQKPKNASVAIRRENG